MAAARRHWILAGLLAAVSALCLLGFWKTRETVGLAGAAAGLAAGGAIAWVGHALRARAKHAPQAKVVQSMLLATFAGFGLFLGLCLVVALLAKEAAAPVLLSALLVYLAVTFHQALLVDGGRS